MKNLILILHQTLFLPHILLFLISNKQSEITKDIYCLSEKPSSKFRVFFDLTSTLAQSKYFRTLFYFRTRGFFSNVLRLFYPRDNRFLIDINTKIGGGVILAHPYSTILNANSIGENFYVNHLVTVGEIEGERPTIGDNVSIYTGAIVIGGIHIGDNSKIGAGAVVVKDVPENSIVVGNPARIIKK